MPDHSSADLLLAEFRAFRDVEFREFKDDLATRCAARGERLVQVETTVRPALINNGQPSRLQSVENAVVDLQKSRYWLAGVCSAASAALGALVTNVLHWFFK